MCTEVKQGRRTEDAGAVRTERFSHRSRSCGARGRKPRPSCTAGTRSSQRPRSGLPACRSSLP
eukprot:2263499-Rhodomonas_salina.1